jgi:hypothetical protein
MARKERKQQEAENRRRLRNLAQEVYRIIQE